MLKTTKVIQNSAVCDFGASQELANLVDLQKCCRIRSVGKIAVNTAENEHPKVYLKLGVLKWWSIRRISGASVEF